MCIDSKIENGSVKQRLMEFIKYKGISIRNFETIIGVSNGYFGKSSF